MTTLSIKDVPDSWAEALRRRAARNHRSLQGELMALVEQAVNEAPAGASLANSSPDAGRERGPRISGYDRYGWPIIRQGWKTPEQVIAEVRTRYPEPVAFEPLGADIIRQDRDSR